MTLRDADSLLLETGQVPEMRRRGRSEKMAMPALEAELIEEFVHQVTTESDRASLDQSSIAVTFVDGEGAAYTISIHRAQRGGNGYQLVARRTALASKGAGAAGASTGGAGAAAVALAVVKGGREASDAASARPSLLHMPQADARTALLGGEEPAGRSGEAASRAPVAPAYAPPSVPAWAGAPSELVGPSVAAAILEARQRGASDLFLSSGRSPRLRISGALEGLHGDELDERELWTLHGALTGGRPTARHGDAGSADFAVEVQGVRARCNVFSHEGGVGLAVRILRDDPPSLAELGLPPVVATAVEHREGLVLVCGPTGSGKSTTCAALVQQLDQARGVHLITIEDPIEYRLVPRRGLVHQRELGTHVSSFAAGLRAALRESPDVILLGELRDAETIAAALTAAETGHLVLATMHAPNAAGAVDRILDAFEEGRQRQVRTQLAGSLRMVITQQLLARQGGGRVVAAEVVPVTPAVANIIRKGELQTLATAIQSGREAGMIPLERSLAQLVQRKLVSEAEAKRAAQDAQLLRAQLG